MQKAEQQTARDVLTSKDIVNFLKRSKWWIAIGGILGLLFSTAFVLIVPNKYEARLQLQMAQFVTGLETKNGAGNIEEPAAMIQRLRMPTAYSGDVQHSCGVQVDEDAKEYLGGILKIDIVKNVPNAVEMKVRATSPEKAKQCAEAIVAMVVAQQSGLIEERLVGRQAQLAQYHQAFQAEQLQLKMIKKAELTNFGYLAKLDKLSWLRTRIDALQEEALLSQMHPAKLVSPIYVPSTPVTPKVGLMVLLGTLLGVMLGLLYAFGREGWRKAT